MSSHYAFHDSAKDILTLSPKRLGDDIQIRQSVGHITLRVGTEMAFTLPHSKGNKKNVMTYDYGLLPLSVAVKRDEDLSHHKKSPHRLSYLKPLPYAFTFEQSRLSLGRFVSE